ncbi:MAG: pseudouridine synthase [Desulfobacterales bacterium]|nr:MAG: pseudouridine synthase [Desulfobacterales bacterium]
MAIEQKIRLQKYLAASGIASRRKAEEMIRNGTVSVDGIIITEMGVKIDPLRQKICVDNLVIAPQKKKPIYLLLNKPRGFVTTLSDPQGRPIVSSLIKAIDRRLFPVGRLDIDTEGALLMTDDGALANKILHPRFETTKTYEALVRGRPSRSRLSRLESGVILDGRRTSPAHLRVITKKRSTSLLQITIHEGRKRQVRKMFQSIGHPVLNLKRLAYGKLKLGSLKSGHYRLLEPDDIKKIFL